MRWTIMIALLLLAGCAQQTVEQPMNEHGETPAPQTNMPGEAGPYAVRTATVAYHGGVSGFEARPAEAGAYPGVVMIHEWWGLNDNIENMAERLASHGYHVLAVDLYEGDVAQTPEEARALVSSFDAQAGVANLQSAVGYLKAEGAEQVASLGWCFGGGQSLALAQAADLDATVIYYGSVTSDADALSTVDEPVLGIFGANDSSIPVSSVEEFSSQLDAQGTPNEIHVYEGAEHAFANPSGDRYKADAAEDAWEETLAFLSDNLERPAAPEPQEPDVVFTLTGENFHFERDGVRNPELRVQKGDLVRIEFQSVGGFHDWVLDEFGAATEQVNAPGTSSVEFVADEAGTFEYYCSVGRHRQNGMSGAFIVEE